MNGVTKTKLPATVDNGFVDTADRNANRVIRGVILKFVDGRWSDTDGSKILAGTRLLAWATAQAVQRWKNKLPIETVVKEPGTPLPDVDELNRTIPKSEWEVGLNGPRPPWVRQSIVYLLDAKDGSEFTFISHTVGAAIAIERLRDRVKNMRALRAGQVVPLIELSAKQMTTQFGTRLRPEFIIHEWRNLGGPTTVPAQAPALTTQIAAKIEEPTLAEELNDEIGF